jgi:2-polyprenyl-6-methoxyphenol hydroxylase-like FAD-dependent oxidoreductase
VKVEDADVVVVGAGPVGLTLAIDLAWRGVKVVVAETRAFDEAPNVKCNHVAARSMEQYRRLGFVAAVRNAGLPPDFPNDVAFRTTVTGLELARIPIPCRAERYIARGGPDSDWPTPEPPHRINQLYFEPILRAHAATLANIRLLYRTRVEAVESVDAGADGQQSARVAAIELVHGEKLELRSRYVVGCDGGSSIVRKQIGARLNGTAVIQRVQSTYIRAPRLAALIPGKRAWSYYAANPRRCGTMFAIDGGETWLIHNHLNPDELEFDAVDRDRSIRTILGVGDDFEYEVISKEDWVGRRLVADRFRAGNVFIAGDAAHLWVPYAGFGMNAGIADATNLAWLLGARLQGWAEETILDAYAAERQPITEQVSQFAMDHAQKMIKARGAVPAQIEAPGPEGEALRAQLGEASYALNVAQFCCAGLNFGYFYDRSPIVAGDGEVPPPYTMDTFTASTVPGCRAPHFWLADGRSLYDAFGPAYTLLRFDRTVDAAPLLDAAAARRMPLALLDIDAAVTMVPPAYRHALVACRSDQHVAWRGDRVPAAPAQLVDVLRGAAATPPRR